MNIPETIEFYNQTAYKKSLDIATLEKAAKELKKIVQSGFATKDNFERADGLFYRIKAKLLAVKYFDGGYLNKDFELLVCSVNECLEELKGKDYQKTKLLLENLLSVAKIVHEQVSDVSFLIATVQDENGELLPTADAGKLSYLVEKFRQKSSSLQDSLPSESIFPSHVTMFNIKEQVLKDLSSLSTWLENEFYLLEEKDAELFFEKNCEYLTKYKFPYLYSSEVIVSDARTTEKTIILSSPIHSEVAFFTKCQEERLGVKFIEFNLHAFSGKENLFIEKVFAYFKKNSFCLLVLGAQGYSEQDRNYLFKKLVEYSNSGFFVILSETLGEKTLYEDFVKVVDNENGLTRLDVCHRYLRLPSFNHTISLFTENNMIKEEDHSFIKANMLYFGYVGLNACLYLAKQKKEWKDEGVKYSLANNLGFNEYLSNIPSQEQFLPLDWVDLRLQKNSTHSSFSFDYDTLHYANPKNVKMIVESDLDLFSKCGLVARYLTLCGDDYSIWKTLDIEEREKRVKDATKLVASLLRCSFTPEVEIIKDEDWEAKGAGGLCIGGGKKIVYKDSCSLDYEWMIDAICHECYHSFQYTLENFGHQDWHFKFLGVTASRPQEWHDNNLNYVNVSKNREGYLRQVLEADARIFAADCVNNSVGKWNLFNLS